MRGGVGGGEGGWRATLHGVDKKIKELCKEARAAKMQSETPRWSREEGRRMTRTTAEVNGNVFGDKVHSCKALASTGSRHHSRLRNKTSTLHSQLSRLSPPFPRC